MAYEHIKDVPPEMQARVDEAVSRIGGHDIYGILNKIFRGDDGNSFTKPVSRPDRNTLEAACARNRLS